MRDRNFLKGPGHCPHGISILRWAFDWLCIYKCCRNPIPLDFSVPFIESLKSKRKYDKNLTHLQLVLLFKDSSDIGRPACDPGRCTAGTSSHSPLNLNSEIEDSCSSSSSKILMFHNQSNGIK